MKRPSAWTGCLPGVIACAALAGLTLLHRLPWWAGALYAMASMASVTLYGLDKRRSMAGRWRVAERTLLGVDLLGGWPGGLLGQGLWRHKTRKASYQVRFWLIVALHLTALTLWLWPGLAARLWQTVTGS